MKSRRQPPRHRPGGTEAPLTRAQRRRANGPPPQPLQVDTTRIDAISQRIERLIEDAIDSTALFVGRCLFRKRSRR